MLNLRVTDAERCHWIEMAATAGLTLSEWMRRTLNEEPMPEARTYSPRSYRPDWCARCNRIGSPSCPKCKGKS